MRQRLSVKKLVVATYLQCIRADNADYHTRLERRALPRYREYLRQIPRDQASAVRDQEHLGLGRRLLHLRRLRAPDRSPGRHRVDYHRARGGSGGIDNTLLGWPRRGHPRCVFLLLERQLEGNVLVLRIMGSSFGVHPLLVLFAILAVMAPYGLGGAVFVLPVVAIIAVALRYLRWTLLFEYWHLPPVVEVIVERAPRLVASGKELADLRGCSAGGEG
jgi:hypothetical protein